MSAYVSVTKWCSFKHRVNVCVFIQLSDHLVKRTAMVDSEYKSFKNRSWWNLMYCSKNAKV